MKIFTAILAIISLLILKAEVGFTQENHNNIKVVSVTEVRAIQQEQISYYKKVLNIDTLKALNISRIQGDYKAAIQKLILEQGLSDKERADRAEALMADKNRQLKKLLSIEQQEKIIPTSERISTATIAADSTKIIKP